MVRDEEEIKKQEEIFEDMFESQVQGFMEQHEALLGEETNVFKMALKFEERYYYVIEQAKSQMNKKISDVKHKNQILYDEILTDKKAKIEDQFELLQEDIDRSLKEHDEICDRQEQKLRSLYSDKKNEFISKVLEELEVDFI